MTFKEFMLENGYEVKTTFWEDFTIGEKFGLEGVRDTFNRCFREWKTNYIYLTEFVMVLNHKIAQHYGHNDEMSDLYYELWRKADSYACENLKDEELDYFYRTTD